MFNHKENDKIKYLTDSQFRDYIKHFLFSHLLPEEIVSSHIYLLDNSVSQISGMPIFYL